MKLLLNRAIAVLVLCILLTLGLIAFGFNFAENASKWALYPTNAHYYKNGQLKVSGKIYDRNGLVLFQILDGKKMYNENKSVRTSLMHATGDIYGNVVTSAQIAFGKRLTGWDMIDGAYRLNQKNSSRGKDLTLTLDSDLCVTAYNALNGRKGTVGVYNYKTGEILCMVSSPSFDPVNPPDVSKDPEKYSGVYLNRLLSGEYTPGSVFKLITAAAAIDNIPNIGEAVYHCDGEIIIDGIKVTCTAAHGDVTLEKAIASSCNVAFGQIAVQLGGEILQQYAEKAGFNSDLKIDGINIAKGSANISDAKGGELAWAGIGQYTITANPLKMMTYAGAIANGGTGVQPTLLANDKSLLSGSQLFARHVLSEETASALGKMMRNAVINSYGEENYAGLNLCAKSGTAEVGEGKKPHSWFVGYLDRDDYPLAFVVVVENGGWGSREAGQVAQKVLKKAVSGAASK